MEDIDMYELLARGPQNKLEEMRIELYEKVKPFIMNAQQAAIRLQALYWWHVKDFLQ